MKKAGSVLLILMVAVDLMFSLTACNNDAATGDANGPVGTYVIGTITAADGTEMTMEDYLGAALVAQGIEEGSTEYDTAMGIAMQAAEVTYTFNEDGTATVAAAGVEMAGTYTVEGTTVTITMDMEGSAPATMEYDSAANTLTATDATTGISTVMVAQ